MCIKLTDIKTLYHQCIGMKKQIINDIEINKDKLEQYKDRLKKLEFAQVFLQDIAKDTQSQLRFQIEDVVNLALETCFPGQYSFQLQFNISRGKTEAELVFLDQKTGRQIDPMNASGGGVIDLTAFALRVSSYVLEPGTDNVIILDEPFRFISRDLQERAGDIIRMLSDKLKLQIILVTHIPELINVADKVFEVKKDNNGISIVKEKKL